LRQNPYKTPWDGDPVKRLREDRQWKELSRLVREGLIGVDSPTKVANLWMRRRIRRVS